MNLTAEEFAALFAAAGFAVESVLPVENMPLLYKFRLFRASAHREFNESLGRAEGYRLNRIGEVLQRLLMRFPRQFCNVYVLIARRVDAGDA